MAEGALFSMSSNILSTIASPSFKSACESIWRASNELEKLRSILERIQALLLDAEKKKEEGSAEVYDWIKRVRESVYDAEDLLDDLALNHMRQKVQMAEQQKEVLICLSKLNPFRTAKPLAINHMLSNSVARRIKAIRKMLDQVSTDAAQFSFVESRYEEPMWGMRKGVGTGWLVDPDAVIGRDDDLKAIKGYLLGDDPNANQSVSVIAIVGMGGLGKTTLAQLVYNDEEVQSCFERKRWTCIAKIVDEKHFSGKDYLQCSLKGSLVGQRYLLVLDAVVAEDQTVAQKLTSLFRRDGARGSRILVTTSSSSVAKAMDADHTCDLQGLSGSASWELFNRIAFTREQLNDPMWNTLGQKVLKKCARIPLAIKSIAAVLYTKTTKEEWRSFSDKLVEVGDDSILPTLRLAYRDLPPNLKQCFACCSIFPKDYSLPKDQLIRLWIAQGFVRPKTCETVEVAGEESFMELLRRSFFQVEKEDEYGVISSCKMHDLIHDLAMDVAQNENLILTNTGGNSHKTIRHLSIDLKTADSWKTLPSLLHANQRLRSSIFIGGGSLRPLFLEQLTRQKFLRAVDLQYLNIMVLPDSIGKLIHLRYLNLSGNNFKYLPKSTTKLLNLVTLEVSFCAKLEELPTDFNKLINLRHLGVRSCVGLRYMPPGLGDFSCLQHLSDFKVGKVRNGVRSSRLDAVTRLQLKGKLVIIFDDEIDNWDEDECWQIPTTLQALEIFNYPGMSIPPQWYQRRSVIPSLLPKLERLKLLDSSTVKHLTPLMCLPYLKVLQLSRLNHLEYIVAERDENESGESAHLVADSTLLLFPRLEDLRLTELPKLKAWWSREVEAATNNKGAIVREELSSCTNLPLYQMPSFPLLSSLKIEECPMLKSMLPSPRLQTVNLKLIREELILEVLSLCSHSIETMRISRPDSLNSFRGETLTSLQHLELTNCDELKNLHLPLLQLNVLEELVIRGCPQLKLWEKEEGVDWDSLTNLCLLSLDEIPDVEMLPSSLRQCQSLGKLVIRGSSREDNYQKECGEFYKGFHKSCESLCLVGKR